MTYELVMPTTLDALHLMLFAAAIILLFLLSLMAMRRKPSSTNPEPSTQAPIQTPIQAPIPSEPANSLKENDPESALQLLGLLQQEARFVDFLGEDLAGFKDDEVGAVARVVHEGSKKVLKQYFTMEPIRAESEESQITLQPGFSASEHRVTGNVTGEPPFTGALVHRGWRVTASNLPKLAESHDPHVIAPAEVEL